MLASPSAAAALAPKGAGLRGYLAGRSFPARYTFADLMENTSIRSAIV
jgi:hypothetical protein